MPTACAWRAWWPSWCGAQVRRKGSRASKFLQGLGLALLEWHPFRAREDVIAAVDRHPRAAVDAAIMIEHHEVHLGVGPDEHNMGIERLVLAEDLHPAGMVVRTGAVPDIPADDGPDEYLLGHRPPFLFSRGLLRLAAAEAFAL